LTGQSPRDIDWPTRRWLLWGVVAIAALAAVVLIIVWLTGGDDPDLEGDTLTPEGVEQIEWSIELTNLTGDTVTLKGDLPLGYPTETWQNDFQIARSVDGSFTWDLDLELPDAVVAVDEAADCDSLNALLASYAAEGVGADEPGLWQARAFSQHAINALNAQGCEIDEELLSGIL
jgi:hypothetical protein